MHTLSGKPGERELGADSGLGGRPGSSGAILCRLHPSGFEKADSNYGSLALGSDGCIYCTLSSHDVNTHGRAFRYDPATDALHLLCDLGEACGEAGAKALPQGKSHTPFFEMDGWMYFGTHYGFFATTDEGREEIAPMPEGYKPYPGGHILRIRAKDGRVEDLATAPPQEGVLTMGMDRDRGLIYALTWPKGLLLRLDAAGREWSSLGPVSRGGEFGRGDQYFCLVRAFAIDPRDGCVYFTNADGQVNRVRLGAARAEPFGDLTLKRDVLGCWDPHAPGHQGYNWRDILWHEGHQCFYEVHPRSGWLFRFDPRAKRPVELLDRIVADDLRRNGQFEPFRYGYLTLELGPRGKTLYYLTGAYAPPPEGGGPPVHPTHLVTYDLNSGRVADHGALRLEDDRCPQQCQCLAVHPDGTCYTAPRLARPGQPPEGPQQWECQLASFANPLPEGER